MGFWKKKNELAISREELYKTIVNDMKLDKLMSFVSLIALTVTMFYFFLQAISITLFACFVLHFLLWANAYMVTKRSKQMMEVI